MSKSILVVICDFLVLSLISLVKFEDMPSATQEDKQKEESIVVKSFADAQMVDLLKMSLDSEREKREALKSDVEKLSQAAKESLEQSDKQQKIIAAREKQLEEMRLTKESVEREKLTILQKSKELEKRVSASEARNAALQMEILNASEKLEKSAQERIDLQKKLGDMRESDVAARMKLESVQAELKQNKENLERLRKESESLKLENKAIEAEKRALATQLEVASTKTQIYEENSPGACRYRKDGKDKNTCPRRQACSRCKRACFHPKADGKLAKGDYKTGKRPPPANAFGNIFPNQVVARKYNIYAYAQRPSWRISDKN